MFGTVSPRWWALMGLVAVAVVVQMSLLYALLWRPPPVAVMSSKELLRATIRTLHYQAEYLPDELVYELAVELGCKLSATDAAAAAPATSAPRYSPPQPPPLQRTVYVITPTYRRPEQLAELTRLAQTLMHVPALHWLVVEDATLSTPLVTELLDRTGIPYEHLTVPAWMPSKPRGVSNRNRGLEWIRANATLGVLYFADDGNAYDIRLFEEMRSTRRVAMWPVGLVTEYGVSTPVVADGKFQGFYDGWVGQRKFPVDMAGFAVSVEFLLQRPNASMPYRVGFEEDGFLRSLEPFEPHEIELKANNCTEILVWHIKTERNRPSAALNMEKYNNTNLVLLKKMVV